MRYRLIPAHGDGRFRSHFIYADDLNVVRIAAQAMVEDLGMPIKVVEHEEFGLVKPVMTVGSNLVRKGRLR